MPEACAETAEAAKEREELLDAALFMAILDDDRREVYNLFGAKIKLVRELDRDMQMGCP